MQSPDTVPSASRRIDDSGLRQLFLDARTHNGWLDKPLPDSMLRELFDVVKFGPTSMNTQPMRLLYLRTAAQATPQAPSCTVKRRQDDGGSSHSGRWLRSCVP